MSGGACSSLGFCVRCGGCIPGRVEESRGAGAVIPDDEEVDDRVGDEIKVEKKKSRAANH